MVFPRLWKARKQGACPVKQALITSAHSTSGQKDVGLHQAKGSTEQVPSNEIRIRQ